jgi:hypothetical protein
VGVGRGGGLYVFVCVRWGGERDLCTHTCVGGGGGGVSVCLILCQGGRYIFFRVCPGEERECECFQEFS